MCKELRLQASKSLHPIAGRNVMAAGADEVVRWVASPGLEFFGSFLGNAKKNNFKHSNL
jgi:hypothetical protein